MTDLSDFLLARIAEDEEEARFHPDAVNWQDGVTPIGGLYTWVGRDGSYGTGITEGHLLAECETKRRIIYYAFENAAKIDGEWGCCCTVGEIRSGSCEGYGARAANDVLRLLALPYTEHPDCKDAWRP